LSNDYLNNYIQLVNFRIYKRSSKICEDAGFLKEHVLKEEAMKFILSKYNFPNQDYTQLELLVIRFTHYAFVHLKTPNENKFYKKINQLIEKDVGIKKYFIENGVTNMDEMIYLVVTNAIFYQCFTNKYIVLQALRLVKYD
jgi:hypothetical protein